MKKLDIIGNAAYGGLAGLVLGIVTILIAVVLWSLIFGA